MDTRRLRPLALAYVGKPEVKTGKEERDLDQPRGILEAVACRSCGRAEWFALEVAEVPIGAEHGTSLVRSG